MRNTDSSGKTLLTTSLSSSGALQVVAERLLDDHPDSSGPPAGLCQPGLRAAARTPPGTPSAGSTGRTRDCRRCRARRRASPASRPAARTRFSSSNVPCTNRMPSASRSQTSWRNGVRACCPDRRRRRACRNPRRPSPFGRTRPVRTWPEAVRGWPGRRSQASASAGQVACDTEDNHTARTRDARHPLIALVAQRDYASRCG